PLSTAAQNILKSMPMIGNATLVFSNVGYRPLSLVDPTAALKLAIGSTDWRLHDLRRTSRTLLSRAGVSADVAERCLGHVVGGIRGVYDKHKYHDEMKQAYEKLASLIERIVNPTANVVSMRATR